MTHITPSTKKVIFLGGPYDKFYFAVWDAATNEMQSKFVMEFDNGKSLHFIGEEADKMRDYLAGKASQ